MAVASANDNIPELLDDVVAVQCEFLRGENARNSLVPWKGSGDNSLDWRVCPKDWFVPPVMDDSSCVSSGVDGLGGEGPFATKSVSGMGSGTSPRGAVSCTLIRLNGREKLFGDVCSGRALTTFGIRPTCGSLLGRPTAGRGTPGCTIGILGRDVTGADNFEGSTVVVACGCWRREAAVVLASRGDGRLNGRENDGLRSPAAGIWGEG